VWWSGAVKIETYEDRIRDFSASWDQLFGWLNFGSIEEFEEKYRGILQQESPAIADKPARRESLPKIAPIRRAYNVADDTGLSSFV